MHCSIWVCQPAESPKLRPPLPIRQTYRDARRRLGLVDSFRKELDIAQGHFDAAFGDVWRKAKRAGVSLRIWLRVHRDALALFVSAADRDAILATPPGQAHMAAQQVARISAILACGRTLFGEVLDQIEAQNLGIELMSVISELSDGGMVTSEKLQATKYRMCVWGSGGAMGGTAEDNGPMAMGRRAWVGVKPHKEVRGETQGRWGILRGGGVIRKACATWFVVDPIRGG